MSAHKGPAQVSRTHRPLHTGCMEAAEPCFCWWEIGGDIPRLGSDVKNSHRPHRVPGEGQAGDGGAPVAERCSVMRTEMREAAAASPGGAHTHSRSFRPSRNARWPASSQRAARRPKLWSPSARSRKQPSAARATSARTAPTLNQLKFLSCLQFPGGLGAQLVTVPQLNSFSGQDDCRASLVLRLQPSCSTEKEEDTR